MGRIITAKASDIRPVQEKLDLYSLEHLLGFFKSGTQGLLLPPAVRQYPGLMAVDGHHRLFLAGLFGVGLKVYIAESGSDFMEINDFPHVKMGFVQHENSIIMHAFEKAPTFAARLGEKGIFTFGDLRAMYGIASVDCLEKYLSLNHPESSEEPYMKAAGEMICRTG